MQAVSRANVVIIGAGPGGLALGAQIMALTKNRANIVMYERFPEYQRHHTLNLKRASFNDFPATPSVQEVVNGFFEKGQNRDTKGLNFIKSLLPQHANVKTSEIEGNFKQLAQKLGIQIVYETIDDPEEIFKRHPDVKVLVGADSSKSEVRKRFFTKNMYLHENELQQILPLLQQKDPAITLETLKQVAKENNIRLEAKELANVAPSKDLLQSLQQRHKEMPSQDFVRLALLRLSHEVVPNQVDLQYIAELKYEVRGAASGAKFLTEAYPLQVSHETIVNEYIGKQTNGVTPITLRAFIDKETFEALQDKATFKHPLSVDDPAVPARLKELFTSYLKMRGEGGRVPLIGKIVAEHESPIQRQNSKFTVTHLQIYHSDDVVTKINGVAVTTLSDAAGGVPFYESFNSIGLPESSCLAKAIATELDLLDVDIEPPRKKFTLLPGVKAKQPRIDFQYYNQFHRDTVRKASQTAHLKNTAINAYKEWLKFSHKNNTLGKIMVENVLGKELVERILGLKKEQEGDIAPLEVA